MDDDVATGIETSAMSWLRHPDHRRSRARLRTPLGSYRRGLRTPRESLKWTALPTSRGRDSLLKGLRSQRSLRWLSELFQSRSPVWGHADMAATQRPGRGAGQAP